MDPNQQTKTVYVENKYEMEQFMLNTKIEAEFKEISKDMALSNLSAKQLLLKVQEIQVMNVLLTHRAIFPRAIELFKRDIFSELQIARSKDGFAAVLAKKNFSESSTTLTEKDEKGKRMFGGSK